MILSGFAGRQVIQLDNKCGLVSIPKPKHKPPMPEIKPPKGKEYYDGLGEFFKEIYRIKEENAELRCLVKKLIKLYIPYMPAIRDRDGLIDIKTAFGYDLDKLLGEDWRDTL